MAEKESTINHRLVSVIVPAFNSSFLGATIESVVRQTYPDWELIVVDDGSTDNTKSIVEEFMRKDKRVRYIYEDNGGQGKARNTGIKNARGELVAFLDHDDVWLPEKLSTQVKVMGDENCVLATCESAVFNSKSGICDRIDSFTLVSELIARKFVFDEIGFFDEDRKMIGFDDAAIALSSRKYFEDHKEKKQINIPKILVLYRLHGNQTSQKPAFIESMIYFHRKYEEQILEQSSAPEKRYSGLASLLIQNGRAAEAREYLGMDMRTKFTVRDGIFFILSFLGRRMSSFIISVMKSARTVLWKIRFIGRFGRPVVKVGYFYQYEI